MRVLTIFLAITLGAVASLAANPDPVALLKKSDMSRNAWPSFTAKIKITNFENGKEDEEHLFEVSQKGWDKTYVEFLSPREKGRHLLMLGDDMWVYLPDTSRPIRITPLERLTGNASNGDVARTNYAADYDPVYVRSEDVNGAACYVLELTARRKGATYRRIVYWVRASDARPVKAEFYLASGKLTKTAAFEQYQTLHGVTLLRRMTIYDQIRRTSHSVMDYLDFAPKLLPDKLFHQGRSERF